MRIPNYLLLAPSGIWHFRMRVPSDIADKLGRKMIKQSLRTSSLASARAASTLLCLAYSLAFSRERKFIMNANKPRIDSECDGDVDIERFDYTVELPGGLKVTAETLEDHHRAMELIRELNRVPGADNDKTTAPPTGLAETKGISLAEAFRKWTYAIKRDTIPKTLTLKSAAVRSLVGMFGQRRIASITRTDLAEWVQQLRNQNITTRTIFNKVSFVGTFFAWCISAGYYPSGDNPARGQVKYGRNEKRLRKGFDFEAFDRDQITRIFDLHNFCRLSAGSRWCVVLGLYTGARVSEIAQLHLDDIDFNEVARLTIGDRHGGQSVKNRSSERTIPIHSDVLTMGLESHVTRLRASGEIRLFPKWKLGGANGAGSAPSSAFSRYLKEIGVTPNGNHKIGFHSLRKTVVQTMQGAGVSREYRAQFVGHEIDDECTRLATRVNSRLPS